MIAFYGVHLVAFLSIGILIAFMIQGIDWQAASWYVVSFVSIVGLC